MRRIAFLLISVATMTGVAAQMSPAPGNADAPAAPYLTQKPAGYRDWKWIASAHEEGKLNSLGAVLGNAVAVKAFRAGTIPFPDGTIIAAVHYKAVHSAENDKIFGQPQSIVPGAPHQRSVHGQGLKKVRRDGRLGLRSFQRRWQTCGCGVHETLLCLPPAV
jgi:hypothetical protein